MTMLIRKAFRFEAAHALKDYPGKCSSLHGHSYRLLVTLEGEVAPETGMVMDFQQLSRVVGDTVLAHLDHQYLNALMPLPTSEHIALWIWNRLKPALPALTALELHETEQNCVILRDSGGT